MRKLIGMVDFVLQDKGSILNMQYANFLKQPLELGMFVACCQDGNILEDPEFHEPNCKNEIGDYDELRYEYQQAKEICLFEGCVYDDEMDAVRNDSGLMMYSVKYKSNDTIEDLVKYDSNLTDSAIKKLGL